jgi:uncharacterized protein (DUF1330 family)
MAAFLVVHVYLRDTQWVEGYVANVPAMIRSYGGEYFAVSNEIRQFEGEGPQPDQVVIFSFPSLEAIDKFINSPEYKPWKDARLEQSSAIIVGFET